MVSPWLTVALGATALGVSCLAVSVLAILSEALRAARRWASGASVLAGAAAVVIIVEVIAS